MLTIALTALGLIAAAVFIVWLITPEPEVPYLDRDGFPVYDRPPDGQANAVTKQRR